MQRTENVELTVLCLIHRNGNYLLQNRLKDDWKGLALPGGHIEKNESIIDAVIREMKEETGFAESIGLRFGADYRGNFHERLSA